MSNANDGIVPLVYLRGYPLGAQTNVVAWFCTIIQLRSYMHTIVVRITNMPRENVKNGGFQKDFDCDFYVDFGFGYLDHLQLRWPNSPSTILLA